MAQSYGSNSAEQHQDELFLTCERWFLCSKIVRQLIISGFQSDARCIQVDTLYFSLTLFSSL